MLFLFEHIKKILLSSILGIGFIFPCLTHAIEVPLYDFSIAAYPQNVNSFLPPYSEDYSKSMVTAEYQQKQLNEFYHHYFSTKPNGLSPWNKTMVESILPLVKSLQMQDLSIFENQTKEGTNQHYGENHKPHEPNWISKLRTNMNLSALDSSGFRQRNRAIAINNALLRTLPDHAPDFYHFSAPGEGFPFDNLQMSSLWAGTPLYILNLSEDKAWALVLTPDACFGWVKFNDIAYASSEFVKKWQTTAKKGLAAITKTNQSIIDSQKNFQFSAYIGSVFPLCEEHEKNLSILIPVKNSANQAVIRVSHLSKDSAAKMPLAASKKNFAKILTQLQNRPYGWGGIFLYNDCSQELKSIFAPFGIWLPRNSAQQAQLQPNLDLSEKDMDERLNGLKEQGAPLMTIIYLEKHVMLFVGTQANNAQESTPITYQNVWGLAPASKDKRYLIGQSLFLPLLKTYPEAPDAISFANKSLFKLVFLNRLTNTLETPSSFIKHFFNIQRNS